MRVRAGVSVRVRVRVRVRVPAVTSRVPTSPKSHSLVIVSKAIVKSWRV